MKKKNETVTQEQISDNVKSDVCSFIFDETTIKDLDLTDAIIKVYDAMSKQQHKFWDTHKCSGLYSENHIFDENQSVKWNKEEVVKQNHQINENMKAYRMFEVDADKIIKGLIQTYNDLNAKECDIIFSKAYSDGHASGYHQVAYYIQEYIDFYDDLLNAKKV